MTKLRDDSPQAFAALREGRRIYQIVLGQALIGWPMTYARGLFLGSGLEFALRTNRLKDLWEKCLADLESELGPLYSVLFDEIHAQNPLRFDSSRAARTQEVKALLDERKPRWRYEFTLDPTVLHSTPLFQIHRFKDSEGRHWHLKVIKPAARQKLKLTLSALRELEALLKPFQFLPEALKAYERISDLRVAAQRTSDLRIERRNLARVAKKGETNIVHPDFDDSDILVTADPEKKHADEVKRALRVPAIPLRPTPFKSKSLREPKPQPLSVRTFPLKGLSPEVPLSTRTRDPRRRK